MMNNSSIKKWDKAANVLDAGSRGEELRYSVYKKNLFVKATGKTLLVAAGTGLDFKYLPLGLDVIAIDFSTKMLEKAKEKLGDYSGTITLKEADVTKLDFEDAIFDTVITSCTFCSVPQPVEGFREIRRTLKPDGKLLMFEHVRPGNFFLGAMADIMNPVSSRFGPNINRRTADNVRRAGFKITSEYNVYLDMVKLFEAQKS